MWSVIKIQNADVPATLALKAASVNSSESSCSTRRFWSVHKQDVNMILSLLSLNFVDAVWFVELDITYYGKLMGIIHRSRQTPKYLSAELLRFDFYSLVGK